MELGVYATALGSGMREGGGSPKKFGPKKKLDPQIQPQTGVDLGVYATALGSGMREGGGSPKKFGPKKKLDPQIHPRLGEVLGVYATALGSGNAGQDFISFQEPCP